MQIIYLARNPKDHIVAYYYHHRLKGIQISLDDFIDLYMAGYLLYGSYFDHVVSYWQLSKIYPNNVLFISYEELKIVMSQTQTHKQGHTSLNTCFSADVICFSSSYLILRYPFKWHASLRIFWACNYLMKR